MNQQINALTVKYNGLVSSVETEVTITNGENGKFFQTKAIWDTGAENSVITRKVADELGLVPISKCKVAGVTGVEIANVYQVRMTLHNKQIKIKTCVTECSSLSSDDHCCVLIGMDVITLGDFSITNKDLKTVMSFRVPSMKAIDYVEEINGHKTQIKGAKVGRNDLCPCGSGLKYKKCCGKE